MKLYVDQKNKYEETKSTAWSFTIVGLVGLIALILIYFDVIPLHLDKNNIIMMFLIMLVLFIFFVIVGIRSFLSLDRISKSIDKQDTLNQEIKDWFISNHREELKDLFYDDSEEILFLQRNEFIINTISEKYSSLSEEDCEHIAEEIYNEIFDEII